MKRLLILLAALLLVGCDYTTPLVTTPHISIDKSLLGLWQVKEDDGKIEQLLVLPLDDKEYLVSYPSTAKDGMFATIQSFSKSLQRSSKSANKLSVMVA
jgi:hypothetical protein